MAHVADVKFSCFEFFIFYTFAGFKVTTITVITEMWHVHYIEIVLKCGNDGVENTSFTISSFLT